MRNEIRIMHKNMNGLDETKHDFEFYAAISIMLTVKYQMPLKAVIYRLHEEAYINDISQYIENYEFIKSVLRELKIFEKKVVYLYSNENHHFDIYGNIYRQMKSAYDTGYAAREEILRDAETLKLDNQIVNDFFDNTEEEDKDDDLEMQKLLEKLWGDE